MHVFRSVPTRSSFSGCIGDLQLRTSRDDFQKFDLTENVDSKQNVDLNRCYTDVSHSIDVLIDAKLNKLINSLTFVHIMPVALQRCGRNR